MLTQQCEYCYRKQTGVGYPQLSAVIEYYNQRFPGKSLLTVTSIEFNLLSFAEQIIEVRTFIILASLKKTSTSSHGVDTGRCFLP